MFTTVLAPQNARHARLSGPYAGFCLGVFFTKLRWTFPEKEARIRSYSAQNALLGGSGGMPPRKILDFRLSEIDSGAVSG